VFDILDKSGSSATTERDDATETDGAAPLLDRRMYLKLTGAAAASIVGAGAVGTASAAGDYDRIVVPAGAKRRIRVESGQTFENKLIDVSAHDAELELIARGDGWEIRNVGFVGPTTNSLEGRTKGSKVVKLAGNGLVENLYLGDGNDPEPDAGEKDMSRDGGIYLSGRRHTGHIEVKRSNISMWADNGAYCSGPGVQHGPDDGGTVQFTDCYLENNNVAGIRLGTNGSGARNCTIVIDDESAIPGVPRKPEPQNPIKHGRGFWIREGTSPGGVLIDDCDVSSTIGGSHEALKIDGDSGCTIRNSRIDGEIKARGRLRRENVSNDPNLTPPAGVPMSAEEAASGGAGLPNHLRIKGTGELAPYEFTVSGDLGAGSDFDTDGTDGIDGSTGSGRVNGTGEDDFYFSGRLTDFSYDGDLEVYVDDERVNPDALLGRDLLISNRAYDQPATYEFSISEDLAATDSVNFSDGDETTETSASGRVNGGADAYRFAGELEHFTHDGPLDLVVDGQQVDPEQFARLDNHLRVQATGERATYELGVAGDLEAGPEFDDDGTDGIDGSVGQGTIAGTSDDDFYFDGQLERFEYDTSLELYLNGEQVDPDAYANPARTLSIVGDGPRATYEVTVNGDLEKSTARNGSINPDDEISGSTASGFVLAGTDSYAFDGEITDFTVDNPDAVTVYLDGEQVDPDRYSLPHEITISNRGFSEPATYRFTVGGDLQATKSLNRGDEISGTSASGGVNGGADTYRYSGSVTAFDNDGPVEVTLDGRVVKSGE